MGTTLTPTPTPTPTLWHVDTINQSELKSNDTKLIVEWWKFNVERHFLLDKCLQARRMAMMDANQQTGKSLPFHFTFFLLFFLFFLFLFLLWCFSFIIHSVCLHPLFLAVLSAFYPFFTFNSSPLLWSMAALLSNCSLTAPKLLSSPVLALGDCSETGLDCQWHWNCSETAPMRRF